MYLEKAVGSLGLILGVIGAILVGRTKWNVSGRFRENPMWAGIVGEAQGTIEGLTSVPANTCEWRWGWRLIWAGFSLQLISGWLGLIAGLLERLYSN